MNVNAKIKNFGVDKIVYENLRFLDASSLGDKTFVYTT